MSSTCLANLDYLDRLVRQGGLAVIGYGSDEKKTAFYRKHIGSTRPVLFESDNSGGYMHGFTGNYLKVKTKFRKEFINNIVSVQLENLDDDANFLYTPK